jgi:hypothetical protein
MSLPVNVDNFARAESERMFASFVADAWAFPELEPA